MDLETAAFQHSELLSAQTVCSDLDYAFELQLQEALEASMETQLHGAAKVSAPSAGGGVNSNRAQTGEEEMCTVLQMQALEIEKYQKEAADHEQTLAVMPDFSHEVRRRNHDANLACKLQHLAEKEEEGEQVEDLEEECEKANLDGEDERPFKMYFKGLISCENVGEERWESLAGAGFVIFDPDDNLVLQVGKPLPSDLSRAAAEFTALSEGLKTVTILGIRNLIAFGDSVQIHNQVTGQWSVRQRKISNYLNEVEDQLQKLDKMFMVLLPRCDNRLALTLAREAIDSQLSKKAEYHHQREQSRKENCSICLEDNDVRQMYEVMSCHHRYCVSCMAQHVEVKLQHGCIPACPHEGCTTRLTVDGCKKFLSSKFIEVLIKRLEEAAIPESDKIYCPYSDCSALMTKAAIDMLPQASSSSHPSTCRECLKCCRSFCIECRVPWHANMSCQEYERHVPQLYGVDAKLHLLAKDNRWRRCTQCKHMIELAEGCNHMTCRCGFEFCYVCGAEWKNKRATCKCQLWDEDRIIQQPLPDEDDDDDDDYEEESEYSDEDYEFNPFYHDGNLVRLI